MVSFQELRQKYPEYSDMSDQEFSDRFYQKFYSDIPRDQFDKKIGFKDYSIKKLQNDFGINTTPLDSLRNIAVGLGQAGQHIGDFPFRLMGKSVPELDIAKTFGAGNSPTDIAQQGIGQFLPAMALGTVPLGAIGEGLSGLGRAGKFVSNVISKGTPQALYGSTQTENPLTGIGLGYGLQAGSELFPLIKSAYNYLRPSASAKNFLEGLSGVNSEKNAERIANTINSAHDIQLEDALKHKRNVLAQVGKNQIYPEDIKSSSLLNKNAFSDRSIEKLHKQFQQNPTFENADLLQSQVGSEIGILKNLSKKGLLDTSGGQYLNSLNNVKNDLKNDMNSFLDKYPDLKIEYQEFKKKYKNNVVPYYANKKLASIAKGETLGVKPETIKNIFSYPTKNIQKVLSDLPQEGKNYILYNQLHNIDPRDPESLKNKLNSLKQSEGFAKYFTPEIQNFTSKLNNQISNLNKLLGISTIGIHPGLKGLKRWLHK